MTTEELVKTLSTGQLINIILKSGLFAKVVVKAAKKELEKRWPLSAASAFEAESNERRIKRK